MQFDDARRLALTLLEKHKLSDWSFGFDHARQRCGICNYTTRTISLSRHFTRLNDTAAVREVILHEIAHALTGPGHGHGPRWRQTARALGIQPQTCAPESIAMPQPAWAIVCTSCELTLATRHRRSLNLATRRCPHCGPQRGQLAWHAHQGSQASSNP